MAHPCIKYSKIMHINRWPCLKYGKIMHKNRIVQSDSLVSLWTDSKNSDYQFYLNKQAFRLINRLLLKIKYTTEMKRAQRELTHFAYFKATELRNLIYYALVYVLKDSMLSKIYEHFLLYVLFIRLLTKQNISDQDFKIAELLIEEFVKNFATIYGSTNMTFNLHSHLHLVEQCKRFGPLNKISGFPFEG
jgi:hypothetical protein